MNKSIINGIDVSESVLTATNNDVYYSQNAVDELQNNIKRLQEENKELKKYQYKQEYLQSEIEKRQKALEKIRNIAEKLITETPEYNSCYYKDECGDNCTPKKQSKVEYCCYENVDKILTIINEVLNNEITR